MANIPIWTGTSTFTVGDTPFGFYDNDSDFQQDADRFADFAARRLGYPLTDVELQSGSFYTALEQATTIYGNEVYSYKIRQDYLSLEGANISQDIPQIDGDPSMALSYTVPNMANIVKMSEQYGAEAGSGGNIDWHKGEIYLTASVQDYDLNQWALDNLNISGSEIEVKRVFFQSTPAIKKYFDPYVGSGTGVMNVMDNFGWGGYSPAINFVLMPISYDMQILQQIELNDKIRRSNHSFEIQNNNLRIFPIPTHENMVEYDSLYFEYIITKDRISNSIEGDSGSISNVSNVPYTNPIYSQINSVGRSWIFEYALALCMEMLGLVRGKYSSIPIPEAEVNLNSQTLIEQAKSSKEALVEKLKNYLTDSSRDKLMERRSQEADYKRKELEQVPYPIYIK